MYNYYIIYVIFSVQACCVRGVFLLRVPQVPGPAVRPLPAVCRVHPRRAQPLNASYQPQNTAAPAKRETQ